MHLISRRVTAWRICAACACLAATTILGAETQTTPRSEEELKALFFVTLSRYVQWPSTAFERATEPLVIGVIGHDSFANKVAAMIKNEQVQGHPLQLKRIGIGEEVRNIHLLFFGEMQP